MKKVLITGAGGVAFSHKAWFAATLDLPLLRCLLDGQNFERIAGRGYPNERWHWSGRFNLCR